MKHLVVRPFFNIFSFVKADSLLAVKKFGLFKPRYRLSSVQSALRASNARWGPWRLINVYWYQPPSQSNNSDNSNENAIL